MLDAAAEDELDDRLPGTAVLGRELDGGTPLRRVRRGQFAQPGGVRETFEMRIDLLSVPVDDSDRLEDAVAALRAELTDGERRRGGVDRRERAGEVGAVLGRRDGVDHECEAPSHGASLAVGMIPPARVVRLLQPGRSNPGLHLSPL